MGHENKKQLYRNLLIFTVVTLGSGWIAMWLNVKSTGQPSQGMGILLWLLAPLLVSIILRLFAGDGWKDMGICLNFKNNIRWYVVTIMLYPVLIGFILLLGWLTGCTALSGFCTKGFALFFQLLLAALVGNFFKNIFEEFAWRGYLAPKINKLGWNSFASHIAVGLVWAGWHLPYYIGLLDPTDIHKYTPLNMSVFIPFVFLGLIAASVVYGELRLLTNSLWPALLLHTIGNAIILTLLMENFVSIKTKAHFLFSPSFEGLLMILLCLLTGIVLNRVRVKRM